MADDRTRRRSQKTPALLQPIIAHPLFQCGVVIALLRAASMGTAYIMRTYESHSVFIDWITAHDFAGLFTCLVAAASAALSLLVAATLFVLPLTYREAYRPNKWLLAFPITFAAGGCLFFLRNAPLLLPENFHDLTGGMARHVATYPWGSALLSCLLIAAGEEAVFRAFLFPVLRTKYAGGVVLVLSSLAFGLVHMTAGQYDLTDALLVFVRGGLVYGATFWWTRSLWPAIALHMGQDFTGMFLFGDADLQLPSLTKLTMHGPMASEIGRFFLGYLFPIIAATTMIWLACRRDAKDRVRDSIT